jgi:formylglycine-generating enzyme
MAQVGKVCIDRWEARLFEGDTAHPHNQRPKGGVTYNARSEAGVFPQAYINRLEAESACAASEKRLCTLGEWYSACRGKERRTFPYGLGQKKGVCNASKPHVLAKLFGTDPHRWTYETFNDPRLDIEPGFLAKSAEYAGCQSSFGVHDQVGNLHEWVSDVVEPSLEQKLPLRDDIRAKLEKNHGHGIFMGGFYSTTNEHGEGCGFVTIGHEPKYHDYSTGFRCCKNARVQPPSQASVPAPGPSAGPQKPFR